MGLDGRTDGRNDGFNRRSKDAYLTLQLITLKMKDFFLQNFRTSATDNFHRFIVI